MLLVGTNAETSPAEWLGWSRTETPRVEILFLLKRSLHLKRINLLYWRDSSNGVGAPANVTIIDDNDVTHSFTQTDLCEAGEGVKWLSFIQEFTALTSYVKLQLEYGAGVDVMLLTEVELIGTDGVNVVTEGTASATVCPTTPPTTPSPPPTTATTTTTTTTVSSTSPTATTTPTPTTKEVSTTQPTTPPISTTQQITTTTTDTATTPTIVVLDTSAATTTPSDTNTTSSPAPPEEQIDQLIIGLIFLIIILIIVVFIVILVVSVFYYMKSKGKGVTDLSCVGTGGKFRKLMSSDVESSRPGLLERMRFKGGRTVDPVYEPVQPKLLISDPIPVKEDPTEDLPSDADSFTDPVEDLHIYAPVSVSITLRMLHRYVT